jgi:hypothetical protein
MKFSRSSRSWCRYRALRSLGCDGGTWSWRYRIGRERVQCVHRSWGWFRELCVGRVGCGREVLCLFRGCRIISWGGQQGASRLGRIKFWEGGVCLRCRRSKCEEDVGGVWETGIIWGGGRREWDPNVGCDRFGLLSTFKYIWIETKSQNIFRGFN